MSNNKKEEILNNMVESIRTLVKKEISSHKIVKEELEASGGDDTTKQKWQIVDAAKNVFNANYEYTNFPAGSHEGVVAVVKPTLHQLSSFSHEIKGLGNISVLDTEDKDGKTCLVLRIKLSNAPVG